MDVKSIKTWDDYDKPWVINIGDKVKDDLTKQVSTVIRLTDSGTSQGIWLDNDYLGGGRHPWEVSKL